MMKKEKGCMPLLKETSRRGREGERGGRRLKRKRTSKFLVKGRMKEDEGEEMLLRRADASHPLCPAH